MFTAFTPLARTTHWIAARELRSCPPARRSSSSYHPPSCQQHQPTTRRHFLGRLLAYTLAFVSPRSRPSQAQATSEYDKYASTYDSLDGPESVLGSLLGLVRLRKDVAGRAFGKVLETGFGTGANLEYYGDEVESLVGLDASPRMLERARERVRHVGATWPIRLVEGSVEHMPFQDGMFDCVVDTFSLCVYADPVGALREMRRTLKKARHSRIWLLEHVKSDFAPMACYQDLTAASVATFSKDCYWNQDVLSMAKDAGLLLVRAERFLGGTVIKAEFQNRIPD